MKRRYRNHLNSRIGMMLNSFQIIFILLFNRERFSIPSSFIQIKTNTFWIWSSSNQTIHRLIGTSNDVPSSWNLQLCNQTLWFNADALTRSSDFPLVIQSCLVMPTGTTSQKADRSKKHNWGFHYSWTHRWFVTSPTTQRQSKKGSEWWWKILFAQWLIWWCRWKHPIIIVEWVTPLHQSDLKEK